MQLLLSVQLGSLSTLFNANVIGNSSKSEKYRYFSIEHQIYETSGWAKHCVSRV